MPQSLNDIELRSEEVQEVLSSPPSWLVRWGLTILLLLIVLLLGIAHVVRYPEVISAEVMLTTQNPPIKTVANSSGKLAKLLEPEGALLTSGDVIAEIENPITSEGIVYMKTLVNRVEEFLSNPETPIEFSDSSYVFGEIQTQYNDLKKQCTDYHQWKTNVYQKEEVKNLKLRIRQYHHLVDITEKQKQLFSSELAHAEEKYQTDQILFEEGVLAKMQFYQEESAFLQQQQQAENLKKSATQNRITLLDLEKQLLDIKHGQEEQERNYRESITLSLHAVLNQIDNWQKSYLLIAPITGRLSYLTPLNRNQFIQAGEFIFAVVPENETYIGIVNIPTKGFGKVKIGQNVSVKFDNYPYQEYGQVNGIIKKISPLANDDAYSTQLFLEVDNPAEFDGYNG